MKHHDACRPIGKCKGCCLNLRTVCAAGLLPKDQWRHGRCNRYGDAALLAELRDRPGPSGAKLAYLKRRQRAVLTLTEPHYNGVLDPGKMAGRAKRQARATV
jgi:hypothetical protein